MSDAVRTTAVAANPPVPAVAAPTAERDGAASVRDALGNRGFGHFLQAKLAVGSPSDPLEREADDVAARVTDTPDEAIQTRSVAAPQIQRSPVDPEEEEEEEPSGLVQAKSVAPIAPRAAAPAIAARVSALRGGGEPLSPATRSYFEPRFGRDLSAVRTHTGSVADDTSRAIGAHAFTFGRDIAFRSGAFAPHTDDGRRLLAHELTHVVQQTGEPAKRIPTSMLSQPGEAGEREARASAGVALRGRAERWSGAGSTTEHMPHGLPSAIASRRSEGRPLADASDFETRFGLPLRHVRVHDDAAAAALTEGADARAFTAGSHIFFNRGEYRPATPGGRALIAHELAHVARGHSAQPRVWRQPKYELVEPSLDEIQVSGGGGPDPDAVEQWERMQVFATGMDEAARTLGAAKDFFTGHGKTTVVFVGLHPKFLKVYDQDGKPLGPKVPLKTVKGLTLHPGIYVPGPKGLTAVTMSSKGHFGFEPGQSRVGSRPFTKEELDAIAEEEKKAKEEKREPKPAPTTELESLIADAESLRQLAGNAFQIYFVPKYTGTNVPKRIYSSPIEGRGDGQPANAPPWPVSVDGPKLVPVDADPTYSAKVDWTANGNYNLASQVISQVGETIHYRWERFDITQIVKQQAKTAAADKKADPKAKPEKTLDERVEEFKTSARGTGEDVTGMGGAKREFKREFEDWWKDTKRAGKGSVDPGGDTLAEKLSNAEANRIALELSPVSLLTTAVSATVKLIADLFAGPRQQQEVPFEKKGVFLIRVISTPGINEDTKGEPIIRPPSVAAKITEVTEMGTAVEEALDEPEAQLAELQAQIDMARKGGNEAKAEYLESLLAKARSQFESTPLDLLVAKRNEKQAELDKFRHDYPTLSDYSRAREVEMLDDQINLYRFHDKKRTEGAKSSLPGLKRLNATLISEVTGEQYPLLLSAGPMEMEGSRYQWMISDVTNREGDAFTGLGSTKLEAFQHALEKFGKKAAYGRGRIGVRTAGLGLEDDAPKDLFAESAPADWALAEKRIDDLVTTLALLGLFVASAGTVGAVVGAAVAAARLIQRWQAGKLYLDAQTISDALSVLGGFGAAGQVLAGLRLQKFEKAFVLLQEGRATETEIAKAAELLQAAENAQKLLKAVEVANEAINYGGLIWGNVTFIDQMLTISAQEQSGAITHAAARRARAQAISAAVQNNGMFVAGNVMKGREQAKASEKTATPVEEKVPGAAEKEVAGGIAEEGNHPAQKPGDPVPIGERRATLAEMKAAMPKDLQHMVVIDDSLHGDSVHVEYTLDKSTGLISEITVRCGPDARPRTIELHAETVRTMQKYQGLSGRVRQAIGWVRELVGMKAMTPDKNPTEFKAKAEIEKLPKLIDEQMQRMKNMEPNARADAEVELEHLEMQLEEAQRALELGTGADLGPGDGADYVAAKGLSAAKKKEYQKLRAELNELTPGTEAHKDIRRKMYELIGGTLEPAVWEKVYDANVGKAKKAAEAVLAERKRLGWTTEPERTIDVSKTESRRLDLAQGKQGVEVKAYEGGTVYASEDIVSEAQRDAKLVNNKNWKITWIFLDCKPSGPLLEMLSNGGITVELRTSQPGGDSILAEKIPPYTKAKVGVGSK